jgi:hypothetical protein
MKIKIYINSSKRPDNVRTLRQLPPSWKRITQIVTPIEQAKAYAPLGWPVLPVPDEVPRYLSSQRQWVMENADCDYVFFMDDDLDFSYRLPGVTNLKKSGPKEMGDMLAEVMVTMKTFPLVGISTRFGNNHILTDHDDINRVTRCYCVDKKTFSKVGCTFAPYEPFAMQDFHVALCFLEKGYPDRILYTYAQGDPGSNTPGGCSDYRTYETHQKAARYLVAHHPESVQLRAKKTEGGWDGFKSVGGEVFRTDVVVSWKKAYKPTHRVQSGGINAFLGGH